MLKPLFILLFFNFSLQNISYSQYTKQIDSMYVICNRSMPDSEKIKKLDKLAEYYFIYNLNKHADSILHEELQIAELSNNPRLKFAAYFGNATLHIGTFSTSENFDKAENFMVAGINYAVSQNNYTYTATGYSHLSQILLKRGENNQALEKAKRAIESLLYLDSDSLKATLYIDLGKAYSATGDYVSACDNYNKAFDLATSINSITLQSEVYHGTSNIYRVLNIKNEAEAELDKSAELNKSNNNPHGLVTDYYALAGLTNEKYYVILTRQLADSIHDPVYMLQSKMLMLAFIEAEEKNSSKAINYFETEPDFKNVILNSGLAGYYNYKADIYLYSGQYDSAVYYFKLSEDDFIKNYDQRIVKDFFWELGMAYDGLYNWKQALNYFNQVLQISKKMNDINSLADISDTLSNIYNHQGNYKKAFQFSRQSIDYQNQLKDKAKEHVLALSGVERENRKHAEEIKMHELKVKQSRNIQYMLITLVLCVVLLCIFIIGAFPVSKGTIQMLGYFFFISLFEFIVLCIDNAFFSTTAHNQPIKLWVIKIALIACLVPIQHFLEHNLIKYLQSRKLLEARTKFSFKKLWNKIFKSRHANEQKIEEDTAIL